MRIVIINGSPRTNGATAKILHALESCLLKHSDVSVEFINLSKQDIKPCIGCMSCYKTGKCHIKDDAEKLSELIGSADGLIMGSPTYASNVSGQLKTFIDRGHFVMEQLLYQKHGISVATGVNYGSSDACRVISKLMRYSGAYLTGSIVCNTPFGSDPCDEKMLGRISKLSEKLYRDIKREKSYPVQKLVHSVIFSCGIKPFVKKNAQDYTGTMNKWRAAKTEK